MNGPKRCWSIAIVLLVRQGPNGPKRALVCSEARYSVETYAVAVAFRAWLFTLEPTLVLTNEGIPRLRASAGLAGLVSLSARTLGSSVFEGSRENETAHASRAGKR